MGGGDVAHPQRRMTTGERGQRWNDNLRASGVVVIRSSPLAAGWPALHPGDFPPRSGAPPALIEQHPGVSEPQTPRRTQQQRHPSSFSSCRTLKLTTALVCPSAAAAGETAGIYHGDKHGHALKIKHRRPDDCQNIQTVYPD